MSRTKSILVCLVVIGAVFVSLKLFRQGPQATQAKSLTVSKAWWPVWDTFQIGVNRHENVKQSFQTTFNQAQDYGLALKEFKEQDLDASTLTICEAIQAASEGASIKIVLLLDYTIGSDGVVAKDDIRSLQDLKGKRIGIEEGTIAHFTALKALEQAGLDQTEVEFINLGTINDKLTEKMTELAEFNQLAVDRESKMIELKDEINQLLVECGQKEEYEIVK